jgi:hypothetical protein
MLLLAIVGLLLGTALGDWFATLGRSGVLVGVGVAGCYFTVMNSIVGRGQKLGKRLFRVQVLTPSGELVPLARSGARFVVLFTPCFLRGAAVPGDVVASTIGASMLSLAVVGLAFANL